MSDGEHLQLVNCLINMQLAVSHRFDGGDFRFSPDLPPETPYLNVVNYNVIFVGMIFTGE